jgi:transcription antitermination factor NusG
MLKISENPPQLNPRVQSLTEFSDRWWIAHTRARFEKALAWDLLRRDIGYFLPLVERVRTSGGRRRRAFLPLFPSYVFFSGNENDHAAVWRTNRICRILPVVDQEELSGELAAVERVLRESDLDPYPRLPVGERCRVVAGPLAGLEGVVLEQRGRTRILLQVSTISLGAALEIDSDLLERGRGREREKAWCPSQPF